MLVAITGGQRVEARDAVQLVEYHCAQCGAPVIPRQSKSSGVVFAHRRRSRCRWSNGESQDHQAAKLALRDAIAPRCLRIELEWEFPWFERPLESVEDLPAQHGGDRRADLVVWSPTNRPIAIELQHSAITIKHLEWRALSFASAGVAQIWLPFLTAEILASAAERPGGKDGDLYLAQYSAPRWQRWLHGYNFGELWFYGAARGVLWRGHFSPHYAAVTAVSPEKNLNDAKDIQDAHELRRPSKRWRELTLWGPYRPAEVRINLSYRAAAELSGYRFPAGPTARFVAPVPSVTV
jgi:competence protein CoiA